MSLIAFYLLIGICWTAGAVSEQRKLAWKFWNVLACVILNLLFWPIAIGFFLFRKNP